MKAQLSKQGHFTAAPKLPTPRDGVGAALRQAFTAPPQRGDFERLLAALNYRQPINIALDWPQRQNSQKS